MKTKFTILLFLLLSFQIGKSQFTVSYFSTEVCLGTLTQFTSYSSPTNATSWHWDFGDGDTSNAQNPTHLYSNSGTYIVKLVASDGVDVDSISKATTIVYPLPITAFTSTMSGSTVQFIDQSTINPPGSIVAWFWNFGDGTTSQFMNPTTTYSYPPDTCYDVILTLISDKGCLSALTKVNYICIDSTTSINEIKNNSIVIYPSPIISNQDLTIKGKINGLEKIIGYDVLGNMISLPIISKNENEIIFKTNQLNKGVCFLQLHFDNKTIISKKIVVQ